MCTSVAATWITWFNYLLAVVALLLVGLGSYGTIKEASAFTYLALSIGGFMLLISFMGVLTAKGRQRCGPPFMFAFTTLLLFEGVLVCALVFAEDKTLNWIESIDSSKEEAVEKTHTFMHNHIAVLKYVALAWLILQTSTLLFTACSYLRIAQRRRERLGEADEESPSISDKPLLSDTMPRSPSRSRTPMTDDHRTKMAAKYGDKLSKKSSTSSDSIPTTTGRKSVELGPRKQ